jgi:hypothetical protein
MATVAFKKGANGPMIAQIRGPSNNEVPKIEKAISQWLCAQRKQDEHEAGFEDNQIPPADAAE